MSRLLSVLATALSIATSLAQSTTTTTNAAATSPPTNASLEWPYSVVLANDTALVQQCAKVSGFSFRNNTRPNALQVSRMCAEPSCGNITTLLITERSDRASFVSAYEGFAVPMLDFCYYMRLPGTPCPADKIADFTSHEEIREKDANCARSTGLSILNSTQVGTYNPSACSPDCLPLSQRIEWLYDYMPCSRNDSQATTKRWAQLVYGVCSGSSFDTYRKRYQFTPGWPVPPVRQEQQPEPTASTSSRSDSSSSDSAEAPLSPDVGSDEAGLPAPFSSDAKTPSPRSGKITTKPDAKTQEDQSSEQASEDNEVQDALSVTTTTTARGGRSATTAPREQQTSSPREDEPTLPPPGQAVTGLTSSQDYAPYGIGAAVCTLLMCAIFVSRSRKRVLVKDSDSDRSSLYSTLDSPSSEGRTQLQLMKGQGKLPIQKVIATKHIQDIRIIGSGGFGVAYLVRDTLNDRLLASKRLVPNQVTNEKIDLFFREIQLVSTLQHPCIVTFIGATWTNRTDVQALFEYMDGGDLRTYLDVTPVPTQWTREKLTIAIDVADALVYVHSELPTPLVHRDLKSRNILLSKSPLRAKVSDFGVAREVTENGSMTNGVGTSRWLAPEVILGKGDYGTACDVYSFGVVLSELDTHQIPFSDCGRHLDLNTILPEIVIMRMVVLEGCRPSFSASCPVGIRELAQQCMAHEPSERPTAEGVVSRLREIMSHGIVGEEQEPWPR